MSCRVNHPITEDQNPTRSQRGHRRPRRAKNAQRGKLKAIEAAVSCAMLGTKRPVSRAFVDLSRDLDLDRLAFKLATQRVPIPILLVLTVSLFHISLTLHLSSCALEERLPTQRCYHAAAEHIFLSILFQPSLYAYISLYSILITGTPDPEVTLLHKT
jgi:hypothetical protein